MKSAEQLAHGIPEKIRTVKLTKNCVRFLALIRKDMNSRQEQRKSSIMDSSTKQDEPAHFVFQNCMTLIEIDLQNRQHFVQSCFEIVPFMHSKINCDENKSYCR